MAEHKVSTIISKGSDKPKASKERYYVDPQKFLEALKERKILVEQAKENGEEPPRVSEYLGECILKIAQGLARNRSFVTNPNIDDMIGDGVRNCIRYIDNFDANITENPFSYFTQICSYAFVGRINKEEKVMYEKYKITMNAINTGSTSSSDTETENDVGDASMGPALSPDDYMRDFVERYEAKIARKKEKAKAKKKKKGLLKNVKEDSDDE